MTDDSDLVVVEPKYPKQAVVAVQPRWLAQLTKPGVKVEIDEGFPDAIFRFAYWDARSQMLYLVLEDESFPEVPDGAVRMQVGTLGDSGFCDVSCKVHGATLLPDEKTTERHRTLVERVDVYENAYNAIERLLAAKWSFDEMRDVQTILRDMTRELATTVIEKRVSHKKVDFINKMLADGYALKEVTNDGSFFFEKKGAGNKDEELAKVVDVAAETGVGLDINDTSGDDSDREVV